MNTKEKRLAISVHHRCDDAIVCLDGMFAWAKSVELVNVISALGENYSYSHVELVSASLNGEFPGRQVE